MNRRQFLRHCGAASAAATTLISRRQLRRVLAASGNPAESPVDGIIVPDEGWNLWIDEQANWESDEIHLPDSFDLAKLPVNLPTGGWPALDAALGGPNASVVKLPATVEQHFWKRFGARPYTPDEYRYAADDHIPENGAYRGVSWWWRDIQIPASLQGQRILLKIRGARMRAEVYLNEHLAGYSIMEELPFECDLTSAARPGGKNRLAIRITNPGGRYDWVDGGVIRWGQVNIYRSHGFGGLDREMTLRGVPLTAHIGEIWALNTPEPKTINAFLSVSGAMRDLPLFEVIDPASGQVLGSRRGEVQASAGEGGMQTVRAILDCPEARLWDLASPVLYHLRATLTTAAGQKDSRTIAFGFRWFAPQGLGTDALFRLNGRRIKLYSAISWGFWGFNGLWPTPELAVREVTQAKVLGLNCLNFHRNVGKEDVFRTHDRLGVLRYMEPGGGKLSIGKTPSQAAVNAPGLVMEPASDAANQFSRQFMVAKCKAMVRAFRSHPSLIQYTLQNEIGADLKNPDTVSILRLIHQEDPSRSVVLNDGFVARKAAQAWLEPYGDKMHRSDEEPWGGWWIDHQGAGDQWYDEFYQSSEHFTYRQPLKTALAEFGEMEGCAVADNHALIIHQIESGQFGGNGKSYDLEDHRQIFDAYDKYLDRWGFRKAFPTSERLFSALGDKAYESWQQYMENVRISDEVDFAAISGWESTAIENHSGVVDNLRNFKGNPELIASSLRPIRPVAKQHKLCCALGESAVFDLYFLNDTSLPLAGKLQFSVIEPGGESVELGSWPIPNSIPDQFSYTIQTAITSPPLTREGIHTFRFSCDAEPRATFTREIWVVNSQPSFARKLSIGTSGVLPAVKRQLAKLTGVEVSEFSAAGRYDLIVTSGVVKGSKLDRSIGDETGLEAHPAGPAADTAQVAGQIEQDVLTALSSGTPLLAIVPDDYLADGAARQLAALGAFTYQGQVGDTRAPWMGNWLFVREHATFSPMPVNRVLGVHYQARGKASNGLLIERAPGATDPEVIVAYSRDHDRKIGAASFVCKVGSTPVLVHRAPEFSQPLQQRWLANCVAFLTGAKS